MRRLFFALWPDTWVCKKCSRILEKLSRIDVLPVSENNLHVTLLFLGYVETTVEIAIIKAADALRVPAMTLTFDNLCYWKKPGILCLTSSQFDNSVVLLSEQLSAIATQQGLVVDSRPYTPHISLARKAKGLTAIEFSPFIWHAHDFCLVESRSLAGGVEYRVVKRWDCLPTIAQH